MDKATRKRYAIGLSILLVLFCFRVAAQLAQATHPISLLPPFESWHSGALPYRLLLASQGAIILACAWVVARLANGRMLPNRTAGKVLLGLGTIYFGVMAFRLVAGLTFGPEHPWFGARIPTFFHVVLASFLLLLGRFHHKYG